MMFKTIKIFAVVAFGFVAVAYMAHATTVEECWGTYDKCKKSAGGNESAIKTCWDAYAQCKASAM